MLVWRQVRNCQAGIIWWNALTFAEQHCAGACSPECPKYRPGWLRSTSTLIAMWQPRCCIVYLSLDSTSGNFAVFFDFDLACSRGGLAIPPQDTIRRQTSTTKRYIWLDNGLKNEAYDTAASLRRSSASNANATAAPVHVTGRRYRRNMPRICF